MRKYPLRILKIQLKHSNTPTHNHMNYGCNACCQGTCCLILAQLAQFSWKGHQGSQDKNRIHRLLYPGGLYSTKFSSQAGSYKS